MSRESMFLQYKLIGAFTSPTASKQHQLVASYTYSGGPALLQLIAELPSDAILRT